MKKKLIATMLLLGLLVFSLTGCQNDAPAADAPADTQTEQSAGPEDSADTQPEQSADTQPEQSAGPEDSADADTNTEETADTNTEEETILPVCSLCEVEKECGTYTVDGQDYLVCDDCYPEFETGMLGGGNAAEELQVCGGCELEKECQVYTIDGFDYIVCDDCYDEFATGMGLQ